MSSPWKRRLSLLVALPLATAGCFYTQGVRGGLEILRQRRPVGKVLADPGTSPALARQLELAAAARKFAIEEMGLPDNGSYSHFTDLGRPYAVWNVVATGELSVEPLLWCFPFAGCVSYRGYFSEARARRFARRLEARGLDVQVSGASTYSTLGWFKDPILSTFVDLPSPHLGGILFHELAHQRLYLKGDTVFNESFATVVQDEGVGRWLASRGEEGALAAYRSAGERRRAVSELLRRYRGILAEIYGSPTPRLEKLHLKQETLGQLRGEYRELRRDWGGYEGYDSFFEGELNNAHLAAVAAYHDLVPELQAVLEACAGDLECFYRRARSLGEGRAESQPRLD